MFRQGFLLDSEKITSSCVNLFLKLITLLAQEGQLDCVMWLTKYSSVPASEASHDGMTAVHASAQEGHLDCVRYLVQFARCSATKMDHTGCTPLHFGMHSFRSEL